MISRFKGPEHQNTLIMSDQDFERGRGEASVGNEDDFIIEGRAIGDILIAATRLNPQQVQQVLLHQMENGGRFGDVAVAKGFVADTDVQWALAQQFHYAYAGGDSAQPYHRELVMANDPFGEQVEAIRDLRSHLALTVLAPTEARRPALAVVSANKGDGKTFLAANLAVAFSQLPARTLVVDCDLRSPRLHQLFGLDNSSGLSSILAGRALPNLIRPVGDLPNLYLLPVGTIPPNPLELVQRTNFTALLTQLRRNFDYVILDTPAASHGSDARVITTRAGSALFVGRRHRTKTREASRFMTLLAKAKVQIGGVVMNEF